MAACALPSTTQSMEHDDTQIDVWRAAATGDVERVTKWLNTPGHNPNLVDTTGSRVSLLGYVTVNGSIELARLLLERGASINLPDDFGFTPLHYAANEGHPELCAFLLDHGADIRSINHDHSAVVSGIDVIQAGGQTALHLAARNGEQAVVELLVARGAEPDITDYDGLTPYHLALDWCISRNELGILRILHPLTFSGAQLDPRSLPSTDEIRNRRQVAVLATRARVAEEKEVAKRMAAQKKLTYQPEALHLVNLSTDVLAPALVAAIKDRSTIATTCPAVPGGAFKIPVFTENACSDYQKEIKRFESITLPLVSPEGTTRHGIALNRMALMKGFEVLSIEFLTPVLRALFPSLGAASFELREIAAQKNAPRRLAGLGLEAATADYVINICLGGKWKGGDLLIDGNTYRPETGTALVYPGRVPVIGNHLLSGERWDLTFWCYVRK